MFSSVDLGSGVSIDIEKDTKRVFLQGRNPKQKDSEGQEKFVYPKKPSPVTITEVDGLEYKIERTAIRYEKLEDVLDELPEFVQDILSNVA